MNRRFGLIVTAAAALAACTLPGCIIVDGSSSGGSYRGYGALDSAGFDSVVASNTQNRIGDSTQTVLSRFPADNVSLVHSAAMPGGGDLAVYRLYARERDRSTRFERYYVFENDALVLLTDDRDEIPALREHAD